MSDFVFSRYMDETSKTSRHINNYFEHFEEYNSNLYQILEQIPKGNLVHYIYIVAILFFIFSFYEIKLNHILVLLLSILIIGYLIQKDFGDFNHYTSQKKDQLKFLNQLCFDGQHWRNFGPKNDMNIKPMVKQSYLYLNPLVIEFFFNIREFTQYNLSAYVDCVLHVNHVMKLHQDIKQGLENPFANLDLAKEEIASALNSLESTIYKLPISVVSNDKYSHSVKILQSILTKYTIEMEQMCQRINKKRGYDAITKPDDQLNSSFDVSPNDTTTRDYNPSYDLFVA